MPLELTPDLELRLQEIESRLEAAASGSESSTPPNGLVVNAKGEIFYEFEGKLIATGLVLKEAVTAAGGGGSATVNQVAWIDVEEKVQEWLIGFLKEGNHQLWIGAGTVEGEGGVRLKMDTFGRMLLSAGLVSRQLFSVEAKSHFPMFPETEGAVNHTMSIGQISLTWAASKQSGIATVNHGLPGTPKIVLGSSLQAPEAGKTAIPNFFNLAPTKFEANAELQTVHTGTFSISYLAMT